MGVHQSGYGKPRKFYLHFHTGRQYCKLAKDCDELITYWWLKQLDKLLEIPQSQWLSLNIADFNIQPYYEVSEGRRCGTNFFYASTTYHMFLEHMPQYQGIIDHAILSRYSMEHWDIMVEEGFSREEWKAAQEAMKNA